MTDAFSPGIIKSQLSFMVVGQIIIGRLGPLSKAQWDVEELCWGHLLSRARGVDNVKTAENDHHHGLIYWQMTTFKGPSESIIRDFFTKEKKKPFIHKSFRLLHVKDEKNKELGGHTLGRSNRGWKALINHFHPRSNDRVSTALTRKFWPLLQSIFNISNGCHKKHPPCMFPIVIVCYRI